MDVDICIVKGHWIATFVNTVTVCLTKYENVANNSRYIIDKNTTFRNFILGLLLLINIYENIYGCDINSHTEIYILINLSSQME